MSACGRTKRAKESLRSDEKGISTNRFKNAFFFEKHGLI